MEKIIYEAPSAVLIQVEATANLLVASDGIDRWGQDGEPVNF